MNTTRLRRSPLFIETNDGNPPQSSVGAACLGNGNLFNPEKEFVTCSDCWMDRRGGSSGARGFWASAHFINRMLLRSGIDPAGRGSTSKRHEGVSHEGTRALRCTKGFSVSSDGVLYAGQQNLRSSRNPNSNHNP